MGKFRIRVKVQGFELEVDGDREDIPAITKAVQRQLGGILQPGDFTDPVEDARTLPITLDAADIKAKRPSRKKSSASKPNGDATGNPAIDFRHDSATYGSPKQSWSVAQKCIWLLHVIAGIKGTAEVTASQLTSTWNNQFKAAGKLHPPHVPRDLSTAKVSTPAPVGEDKGMWFLTDEGKNVAKTLIKEGLGQS